MFFFLSCSSEGYIFLKLLSNSRQQFMKNKSYIKRNLLLKMCPSRKSHFFSIQQPFIFIITQKLIFHKRCWVRTLGNTSDLLIGKITKIIKKTIAEKKIKGQFQGSITKSYLKFIFIASSCCTNFVTAIICFSSSLNHKLINSLITFFS